MQKVSKILMIACGAAAMISSPRAAAQNNNYRVDSFDSTNVTLTLCKPQVRVEVRGDGDTDLDFTITNGSGEVLHSDIDDTDWTVVNIENGDSQCRKYNLHVKNYGSVYNDFTVSTTTLINGFSDDGKDRRMSVRNRTGETIYYIYWSNTADDSWRDDRLGSEVLADNDEWAVQVDDGSGACRFDFRALTASSREIIRNNVNVCEVTAVDFR